MSLSRRFRALALATTLAAAAGTMGNAAFADPTSDEIATARALGQDGQAALDKKDYKTAEDRYARAWKLYPQALSLGVGYGRALTGNGKLVAAQEAYNKVIHGNAQGNKVFEQAIEDAKKENDALAPRIASVTISIAAAGGVAGADIPNLKVTLDDAPVNTAALGVKKPVDPGAHVVKATADGYKAAEAKFAVNEGGNASTSLTLEKDAAGTTPGVTPAVPPGGPGTPPTVPPTTPGTGPTPPGGDTGTVTPPSSSNKTLMWVSFGVGGAGLIAGGITGFLALGKKSDLDGKCNAGTCPSSAQSDIDSYHTMGLISTIGFAVGIVGAGAGVFFLLTQPKDAPAATAKAGAGPYISPYIGPGSIGAIGRF